MVRAERPRPVVLILAIVGAGLVILVGLLFPLVRRDLLAQPTTTPSAQPQQAKSPSTQSSDPEDGQWVMAAKNYQNTRYSGLDQINTQNVKNLQVAWTFSTGVARGHEGAPLVVGSVMYVVTPFPHFLYALDLTNSGAILWKYEPKPTTAALGVACCDFVNRGFFYDKGKLYFATLDDHVCCVDAQTGKEQWKVLIGDINKAETITMAPIVVRDHVLVGNSGGEYGARGWLKALNTSDGSVAWTAWSTGPDSDCLIGSRFKPFYDKDKGKDLGTSTWPGDHWKIGGGNVWGWVSYDPQLNLIYYGTANPGSWNPELRPGDNKWACTIFARDGDTGQAVWGYQLNPHDLWDHDEINENILLDLNIDGQDRKVLVHPGRNGYMYVMDRVTGEILSATQYGRNTLTTGVDTKTGKLALVDEKTPKLGKVIRDCQPASPGTKDWQPAAWSPRTKLLYVPHQNLVCDYEAVDASYIAGTPYVGVNERMYAGPGGHLGLFTAWDPVQKKAVWQLNEKFLCWSGALATAGDVVFYGTMEGWLKAVDAKTGDLLWKFKTGSGIIAQPISFKGPDGKQYIATYSGIGGWAGAIVVNNLDPRDATAATGFANATRELPNYTTKGGMLYVFALP